MFESIQENAAVLISRGSREFELNDYLSNGDGTYTAIRIALYPVKEA